MSRFNITWHQGAYYVSVPNYKGGEVVTADIVDKLAGSLQALLQANERLAGMSYYHVGRDSALAAQEIAERDARAALAALIPSTERGSDG